MRFFKEICLVILVSICSGIANAKTYCQKMPEAKVEGDMWYIPESEFTKEAANKAIQSLARQVNKSVAGQDFLIENDLKMIKGHLYLRYLAEHKRSFGSDDDTLVDSFCRFLKDEAFVSH